VCSFRKSFFFFLAWVGKGKRPRSGVGGITKLFSATEKAVA
jgi:hypothetical protein